MTTVEIRNRRYLLAPNSQSLGKRDGKTVRNSPVSGVIRLNFFARHVLTQRISGQSLWYWIPKQMLKCSVYVSASRWDETAISIAM